MKSRIRLFRKWKWVKLREVSLPWGSWLCRYRWRWEACRWGGRRRCGRGCWLWPPGPPPRPSDGGNRLPGCWIARRLFGIGKESEKFKSSYKRNQGKTRRGGSQPRRKEAQRAKYLAIRFLATAVTRCWRKRWLWGCRRRPTSGPVGLGWPGGWTTPHWVRCVRQSLWGRSCHVTRPTITRTQKISLKMDTFFPSHFL